MKKGDFDISAESLQKASEVISELLSGFQSETEEQKSVVEETIVLNPGRKLMLEKAIQDAPESIVCLAAFVAEFADQTRKALSSFEDKLEKAVEAQLQAQQSLVKASQDNNEMLKAYMGTPTELGGFQMHPGQEHNDNSLKKAFNSKQEKAIPKTFISSFIEEAIQNKRATVFDMSNFENSGIIPPHLKEVIEASWNSSKNNFNKN